MGMNSCLKSSRDSSPGSPECREENAVKPAVKCFPFKSKYNGHKQSPHLMNPSHSTKLANYANKDAG